MKTRLRWIQPHFRPKLFLISHCQASGFALPMAIALGTVMIALAGASILVAQDSRNTAFQRRDSGSGLLVAEGGVARTLTRIILPTNSVLLTRNYDPINPSTGKNYLGADGIAKNGDESTTGIDEWSSYSPNAANCGSAASTAPNLAYSGTMGTGKYVLRAYRYNPAPKTGTFLIEGQGGISTASIAVTLTIVAADSDFPGILTTESSYLQSRKISGKNANVYFNPDAPNSVNPGLTGSAASGNTSRPQFLNATWSGATDGFTGDLIEGKLVTCKTTVTLSDTPPPGTIDLGNVKASQNIAALGGGITSYSVAELKLDGNATLKVDTTAGPAFIYITKQFYLHDSSKILNVRSDGQLPRVGDLRLFMIGGSGHEIGIFDTTCIQSAFIYNKESDLQIQTSGAPTPLPTGECAKGANIEGVVWGEDLLSSRTNATTRMDPDHDGDITKTLGVTAGITVPDDVSSLSDILSTVGITPQYRFGQIKYWKRVN